MPSQKLSHWDLPYRELLQQNVCAQIFGIFKENWTLCLIKPQSGATALLLLSWGLCSSADYRNQNCRQLLLSGVKSPGSGFSVKSLLLDRARLRSWGGQWPWEDRSGFSIQLLPGKDVWHSVGWKLDCSHPVNESLDDKQPVKDALGHSRHLKKPSRYGTEMCPINCVSVPYMRIYATIKSLTKPSLPFQHLNGVRTLKVWKPKFCSCPCLRDIPSNSLLLWTVP